VTPVAATVGTSFGGSTTPWDVVLPSATKPANASNISLGCSAGEARFTVDGERRVVGAGETLIVPAGVRHSPGHHGTFGPRLAAASGARASSTAR
jgi:hypothetical protein